MKQALKSIKGFVTILKEISKYLCSIFDRIMLSILPILAVLKASHIINKKMDKIRDSQEYSYMKGAEHLNEDKIVHYFEKTFLVQKSFEDKAKTNVFAVTLSVTVIIGVTGLLLNLENGNTLLDGRLKNIVYFLTILISFYLICASFLSLFMIGGLNIMHHMYPCEESLDKDVRKQLLIQRTELNVNLNIKRNNYLYGSIKSIIIALFLLSVLFVIIIFMT